jgi:hypothetical protein
MPIGTSLNVNSNGLIPRASMPPLTSPRPLKTDPNGNANTNSAAGGDLVAKVVGQSAQGIGSIVDFSA